MFLEEIVHNLYIEDRNFECKARLSHDNTMGWLKTVAGFANAEGGVLFIGVEDKSNKLIGFTRSDADKERNYFNNVLNEHIFPRPAMEIDFLRYRNNGQELFVIRIHIKESPVKPVILKYDNIPSIYIRREGFTGGATYEEIIEMSLHSQKAQFDTQMSDIPYDRKDFTKLFDFFRAHNDGKELTDKSLASLGFFDQTGLLKNGAVLFRDGYQEGKTDIQCSVFSGFTRGSERIITINRFSGNLTESIEYALSFLNQRMNHSIIKTDNSHINIDSYPGRALFEGIINALVHRDYFLDGTQIQIDMFKDRLEISSPGSFYQGSKMEKRYDLSSIISKRRNELICGIFVKCNVMEAAGTGFDKIMEDYADADESHKPFIFSESDHFTLVLPDMTWENGIGSDPESELEYLPVPDGTGYDAKVLAFCYTGARTAREIADAIGLSYSTYFRKKILENLVQNGYLLKNSESRTHYFITNRNLVHRM